MSESKQKQIAPIVDRLNKQFNLPYSEIEKIVNEIYDQVRNEDMEELAKTVKGTD